MVKITLDSSATREDPIPLTREEDPFQHISREEDARKYFKIPHKHICLEFISFQNYFLSESLLGKPTPIM